MRLEPVRPLWIAIAAMISSSPGAGCSGRTAADAPSAPATAAAPAAPEEAPPEAAPTADAGTPPPATPVPPRDAVEISLAEVRPLGLVEVVEKGGKRGTGMVFLEGEVSVTLTNRWDRPVQVVHMDPANLVFTRIDTGESSSLVHPCEPGLLLGSVAGSSPDDARRIERRSVVVLAPGESRTLPMGGDWGCGGGPWRPVPGPGRTRVEYRAHRWDPSSRPAPAVAPGSSIGERTDGIRRRLADPAFWEGAYRSNALEVEFRRPRVQRPR